MKPGKSFLTIRKLRTWAGIKVFVAILFLTNTALGQVGMIGGVRIGYATFAMSDLRNLQKQEMAVNAAPLKTIQDFPGFVNFSADFVVRQSKVIYGTLVGATSTGSRVAYSDYSGSSSQNMIADMLYFGTMFGRRIYRKNQFEAYVGGQMLLYSNDLKIESEETIFSSRHANTQRWVSENVSFSPFLEMHRRAKRMVMKIHARYEVHSPGDLHIDRHPEARLLNRDNQPVRLNADGLRVDFGIAYIIK